MTQCEATLQAEGIVSRWLESLESLTQGTFVLEVSAHEVEHATMVLSEQLGEELHRPTQPAASPWVPLLLQPAFVSGLCLALLLLVFFALTGGADHPSAYFKTGALRTQRFFEGEWWRL